MRKCIAAAIGCSAARGHASSSGVRGAAEVSSSAWSRFRVTARPSPAQGIASAVWCASRHCGAAGGGSGVAKEFGCVAGAVRFGPDAVPSAECAEAGDLPGLVANFTTLKATGKSEEALHGIALCLAFVAVHNGGVAVVRFLFDAVGVKPLTQGLPGTGVSLAHAAILRGDVDMLELLEEKAGIFFVVRPMDQDGHVDQHDGSDMLGGLEKLTDTPQKLAIFVSEKVNDREAAMVAADVKTPLTVARLAVRGRNPDAMLAYVERKFGREMLTQMHDDQRTIAHDAVMSGNVDAIEAVRSRFGVEFFRRVAPGACWTVAHEAILSGQMGLLACIEAFYDGRLPFNEYPLVHFAILRRHFDVAQFLCKRAGAEYCATVFSNHPECAPVGHTAVLETNMRLLDVLSELPDGKKWLLGSRDTRNHSIVHTAAKHGRIEVLSWLEERFGYECLTVRTDDEHGMSAAHLAAERAELETLKHLLERLGPKFVAAPDKHGRTVDSIAAEAEWWLEEWERVRDNTEFSLSHGPGYDKAA